MQKIVLAAVLAAFSSAVLVAPVVAKDAPGKCGFMKFFDKKTKKCKSK